MYDRNGNDSAAVDRQIRIDRFGISCFRIHNAEKASFFGNLCGKGRCGIAVLTGTAADDTSAVTGIDLNAVFLPVGPVKIDTPEKFFLTGNTAAVDLFRNIPDDIPVAFQQRGDIGLYLPVDLDEMNSAAVQAVFLILKQQTLKQHDQQAQTEKKCCSDPEIMFFQACSHLAVSSGSKT
jgi:hypothetical protein